MAQAGRLGAEIGSVLVQVQEDLQQLKEKLRDISHDWEETDAHALEAAIERTESGLRKHAEKYLNAMNSSVLTISQTNTGDLCSRQISKWGIPLETSQKEITFPEISTIATKPSTSLMQMSSGSKHKLSMMVKILHDPENACNRTLLNENYGVSLPLINRRKRAPAPTQKLAKGVTVTNLLIAPSSFHLNKDYTSLTVSGRDAEKGLLSLIERGLIPRAARITLEKPFVLPKPLPVQQKPAADLKTESKMKVSPSLPHKLAPLSTHTSKESKEKGSLAPPPSCISVIPRRKSRVEIIQEIQHQELPKHLAANWNRIRTCKRTIIHIPSLGYSAPIREATSDFDICQGSQIGRLCEIQDPNVDVIYVCPFQLSEEMLQYYTKLLGLQAALKSGNHKDVADLQDRFKILTPEAVNSFPNRPMSLAAFLKYSPKTIKRIRNLIRGTDAYIVGGFPNQEDLEVADMLDVPILGPDPEVARLYSSKSGSKRLFAAVPVPVPPGQYDIYSRQQMVEVLTQLIIDYPEVKRWVFKMDNDFGGNGTAYCDITRHLKCYPWILKESHRYGSEIWRKSWAHEPALAKISQELPGLLAQHAQAVNEKRFPTWGKFLQTFVSQGGVIEAFPPSDSITNLTVDMLIEPTGEVTMVSCGDQFHAESPFRSSGTTFPQASVEPQVLNSLCSKIGEACKSRGVVGYFSIDFVTFIHPHTLRQQVWAIDLDLRYSDHLALTKVLLYITNGTLNCGSSHFQVQLIPKKPKTLHPQKELLQVGPLVSRYVIMSSSITHANLSLIYYNVFLQMCKAHGIGYDVQFKEGTLFTLFEDQKRCRFGMITIGEHLEGVLTTFAQHLFIIYQELSAPNLHAETNFKGAVQDIEKIMGIAEQNKLKFEEEETKSAQTSVK